VPGISSGAIPSAGRSARELDAKGSDGAIVDAVLGRLEEWRVGLVEDHAHADHAAAKDGEGGGILRK
jgi:hypothetical protein